ncbi:MAG TPA: LLM class F420-dependent oxidoreductase [Acidimicrobiales bacterium]|nr:LLM class F420-dependent oxidoreductase [Acidimicrobiales bacterium]
MKLGLSFMYTQLEANRMVSAAQRAEALGFDSIWTAEAYGSDAVVPLTWMAAHTERIRLGTGIMQMPGRTPATTAMTASTLDEMSGGRFILGLGLSGPQVVEGWHGQASTKPLGRTREYVAIVREILRRQAPLEHHGEHYDIPYTGPGTTGLGKPLKSTIRPREDLPIYLAAIGPKNLKLTTEIADGLLPIFFNPARWRDAFGETTEAIIDRQEFEIAAPVRVALGADVQACRDQLKPWVALYVGGMGARGRNYYNDLACRYGYEEAAATIQDLYLSGAKEAAAAAVPDELVDEVAFVGPRERVADQIERWKESPATSLIISTPSSSVMETMAELVL